MPNPLRRTPLLAALALAGLFSAALSATAPAAPAAADEPSVDLAVSIPAYETASGNNPVVGLPFDGETKDLRVTVQNHGSDATATGVVMHFSLPAPSGAGSITIHDSLASRCKIDASSAAVSGSCDLSELKPGSVSNLRAFTVRSDVADPDDNRQLGKVKVWVTAEQDDADPDDNETSVVVRVNRNPGIDLAVWTRSDLIVYPGQTGALDAEDFTVENNSNTTVDGLLLEVWLPHDMAFTGTVDGCTVNTSSSAEKRNITCVLPDAKIDAHGKYSLSLPYKVADDVAPRTKLDDNAIVWAQAMAAGDGSTGGGGEDDVEEEQVLILSRAEISDAEAEYYTEPDSSGQDNIGEFGVYTNEDRADVSVTATAPAAPVGGETTVTVTVANNGPWPVEKDHGYYVNLEAPSGTTVVSGPEGCSSVSSAVNCDVTEELKVGESVVLEFTLRIDDKAVGSDGYVDAGPLKQPDPDASNNTARLVVEVIGGGGPGDPSGSGSPSDGATPPDDDDLPITGTSLTVFAVAAFALVAVGAVLQISARRRRAQAAEAAGGDVDADD